MSPHHNQYKIGMQDGQSTSKRLWESKSLRERTIYLGIYSKYRQASLIDPHKQYERGFVEGFLKETGRRAGCQ